MSEFLLWLFIFSLLSFAIVFFTSAWKDLFHKHPADFYFSSWLLGDVLLLILAALFFSLSVVLFFKEI